MNYMLGVFNWGGSAGTDTSQDSHRFDDGCLEYVSVRHSVFGYDRRTFYFNQETGVLCGVLGYFSNLDEVRKLHSIEKTMDTEIIEELYRLSGLKFLEEIDGHFVVFIYDQKAGKALVLQPEHGSILPVYYYEDSKGVTFSTSLRYLLKNSAFDRKLDIGAARKFLYRRYMIPDEETLVEGVKKLVPQRYLSLERENGVLKTPQIISRGLKISAGTAEEHFVDYLEKNIVNVCSSLSDSPPAVSLSGGYDSNLILHLLRNMTEDRIDVATVDGGTGHNEVPAVKKILEHYVDINFFTGRMQDTVMNSLPDIVWRYEGYLFEGGIFLRYCICDLLKDSGKDTVLLGAGANEIITLERNGIFYSKIDNTKSRLRNFLKGTFLGSIYYGLFGSKDPEDRLTREFSGSGGRVKYNTTFEILLKMHDLLLNSFGLQGLYPFVNRETMSAALVLRDKNLHKELHNRKTREILGEKVADSVAMSDIVSDTQKLFETKKETLMKVLDSETARSLLTSGQIDMLKNDSLTHHIFILQLVYIFLFDRLYISGEFDSEFEKDGLDTGLDGLMQ